MDAKHTTKQSNENCRHTAPCLYGCPCASQAGSGPTLSAGTTTKYFPRQAPTESALFISGQASKEPSCLAVPVFQVPQGVVPTTQARPELMGHCRHNRTVHDGYHCRISHHQIVHLDEQGRAPD